MQSEYLVTIFPGIMFLLDQGEGITPLEGTYSPGLLILSITLACFGAYVALVIAQQARDADTRPRRIAWISAGAVAMGGGVWSMHFLGMIAYSLPVEIRYDLELTFVSIIPGFLAGLVVLSSISRQILSKSRNAASSVLIGAGIGAMHFTGMAAMRMDASMAYDPFLFALSIAVAVVLAWLALVIRPWILKRTISWLKNWIDAVSAVIMGIAISGMHYTAMGAVRFFPGEGMSASGPSIRGTDLAIPMVAFAVLTSTLILIVAITRRYSLNASIMKAFFNETLDGVVVADESGNILQFSPSAERMFGYQADEVLGENISLLLPLSERHAHTRNVARFVQSREERAIGMRRELKARRKNSTEFDIEIGLATAEVAGRLTLIATMHDITMRKELEQAEQQAQETLSRALKQQMELVERQGLFVSMVSHEFRTPLAIIDGSAQKLRRRKDSITPETLETLSFKLQDCVKRMTDLMESTLTAGRAEAGEIEITTRTMDLASVIQKVCNRQGELDQTHNIVTDLDRLPPTMEGDPGALDQVFTNLLSNAVKYAPTNPDIEVTGWTQSEQVFVSVRDYGVGIPEKELPKMFQRYFRASTASGIAGTGIGLSLVKALADMHGGTISVASAAGEGSTFTLCLPVTSPTLETKIRSAA